MAKRPEPGVVARNRKARHTYEILDTFECGVVLKGSEVKSLRDAQVQMSEAYAAVDDGEVWLHNVHISQYVNVDLSTKPQIDRKRKLLLHRKEIEEISRQVATQKLTLVPLSIYFKDGKAKVEIALARGRKHADKRHAIAERDMKRDAERALSERNR
ncbi:MAG TPA: SsrA-binding protein SmpB [Acidimicrobiales bacterium]|nr:SsrA-binding protein SmpB [Acidimicrobiales bacterium]